MKIGLISDTHGYLDPKVGEHFKNCDEIWHAGDIGNSRVTDELAQLGRLRAVYGNIDGRALRSCFQQDLWFDCDGLKVFLTHIGGSPPRFDPRVRKSIVTLKPDLFVCGHSHILRIITDPSTGMLYINPGAAGRQGFHQMRTLVRFMIAQGRVSQMEVVELGKRSSLA